jgi:hypothetical protein
MKETWGVVIGMPRWENFHTTAPPNMDNVGRWLGKPTLYSTKEEAEERALKENKVNPYWNFMARRWTNEPNAKR